MFPQRIEVSERMERIIVLVYILSVLSLYSFIGEVIPVFILLLSSLFFLRKFGWRSELLLCLLTFSIATSSSLTDFAAYLLAVAPLINRDLVKVSIPYGLCLGCLALLKTGFGYLSIPLAIFFYYRGYDSRIFVGMAIALLATTAFTLIQQSEEVANNVAILAYYFLCFGVLGLIIEYVRESRTTTEEGVSE